MAAQLYKTQTGRLFHAGDIAIVTVGLPARGKTYISHKLCRYLRWLGIQTRIFSVGDFRREMIGPKPHDWFNSLESAEERTSVANYALESLIESVKTKTVQVAIFDASNTEQDRREFIHQRLSAEKIKVLFIEAICDRADIIESNIRQVKLTSPDYVHMDPEEAVVDFLKRIDSYKPKYSSISNTEWSFIKMVNVGEQIIVNKVKGYLQTRIIYYLMNLHIANRRIYLVRNGESMNETLARSDPPLSPQGEQFSTRLPKFMDELRSRQRLSGPLIVWTSPRIRSTGTAMNFTSFYNCGSLQISQKSSLVEFNPGAVDGLTEVEIQRKYPEQYSEWLKDPYNYRYARAESYHDLAIRLERVLLCLEREKDDLLIIAHPTVLKCIYAYLLDLKEEDIVNDIEINQNEIIELTPIAYGCTEKRYSLI